MHGATASLLLCAVALQMFCASSLLHSRPSTVGRRQCVLLRSSAGDDADGSGKSYQAGQGFGKKKEPVVAAAESVGSKAAEGVSTTAAMSTSEAPPRLYESPRQRREAELDDKIRRLQEEEDLLATDPSVGAVPELVANRMITRIAVLAGVPVFGGLAIFVGAFFYAKKFDIVLQPSIVAYATQAPFILGLLGITYGILSASWDVEEPGSFWGFKEAKINFSRIQEGVKRTGDNAALKEEIEKEKSRLGR